MEELGLLHARLPDESHLEISRNAESSYRCWQAKHLEYGVKRRLHLPGVNQQPQRPMAFGLKQRVGEHLPEMLWVKGAIQCDVNKVIHRIVFNAPDWILKVSSHCLHWTIWSGFGHTQGEGLSTKR